MSRQTQQGVDRAKLTMDTAAMAYDAAIRLAGTRMTSIVDEDGKRPETGPLEVLGSAILFAVAIELALNGLWMEEKKDSTHTRRRVRSAKTARHDLSVLFGKLSNESRKAIAEEVATRGWRVEPVLDFHKAMIMDWRYPINRMSADGGLFWWGPAPLSATFKGLLAVWNRRFPRIEKPVQKQNTKTIKQRMLRKREEVQQKMQEARID